MTMKIRIHDVGHGQAIHAFTPAGETVVIDLGCSASFSPLRWLRQQTQIIDLLIITHPHGDHIDEMLLLNDLGFDIRQFWRPKWLPREEVYKQNQATYKYKLDAYFYLSDTYSGSIAANQLVGNPAVSRGLSIQQFASTDCGISNINNYSGVVAFEYLGVTVIIPGDNEPPSWRSLMKQPLFARTMANVNLFMASHHGRASGYCSDIFQMKPDLCVISDGRVQDTDARNRYSYHAKGWRVNKRSSLIGETRYCITTRCDGMIDIEIGNNFNGNPYLSVEIN